MHARLIESDTMHLNSVRSLPLLSDPLVPAPAYAQSQSTAELATVGTAPSFGDSITLTARRREESAQEAPVAISVVGGGSVRAIRDTGPGTLTLITACRFWDWLPENDRDFTDLPINTASNNPSQQKQYTQELRYAHVGDSYDFLIGAFAFRQEVRTQGLTRFGPVANNDIRLDNTSLAVFGQFNWQVSDRFSIQPGFRVNYDKKVGLYDSVVTNGAGQLVTFASTDPRVVAQRGVASPQRFEPMFSDWNFSYDLTATFEVADDINSYANHAKTFKPGCVNLNGVPNDAASHPILAAGCTIANFRAGFRTDNGFDIFGWLRNAFDAEYFEQLAVPSGNTGLIVGQPGDERTYGQTIACNF